MRRAAAALMVGAAVLAVPATASAHKYKAFAGPPAPPPKSAPKQTSLNRYFPSALRVRAGDSVRYKVNIAHTVTVLAKGAQAPPLAVPDPTGATITPMTDAAGQPFFFNGLPKILQNPAVFAPSGKPVIRGNATFNSGIVIGGVGNDTPTLKFPKAGSYTVLCLLHPGMEQKVTVLKKKAKAKADTDKAVRRTIAKQGVASYARATRASKKPVPANTVMAGVGNLDTVLGYYPAQLTVKAGTTVKFVEGSRSEVHNMVFGPLDYTRAFLEQTEGPAGGGQFSPPSIYGSEPSNAGTYVYTGANHGNGFLWTPLIDKMPGDPPQGLAGSSSIQFTTPGTYHYYCAIHGEAMAGDVVVTP